MRFKSRVFVLLQWAWAYFTFGRGARLITYKTWRFYSGEKIKID
jgi:NADH dehydrogenase